MNFYSHAPRGARQRTTQNDFWHEKFLLTRPSRGATYTEQGVIYVDDNFYSHAPRGARRILECIWLPMSQFLLTRPSRGATYVLDTCPYYISISTHTPLAGRDKIVDALNDTLPISTHTPLAGRDLECTHYRTSIRNFYSHAPRGARLIC